MRTFDYTIEPGKLLTPQICSLVSLIHEHKGKQTLFIDAKKDSLDALSDVARIQSIESSNRIEGIHTTSMRMRAIASQKTTPKGRNEEEIAGYRDALAMVHENHDYIDITPNNILQLHGIMYKQTSSSMGGHWKVGDNVIAQVDEVGRRSVRFLPVLAVSTPQAMDELCAAFERAFDEERFDLLILTCMFVLDFTCVHPFNDGNGRMSRLLTLLALYRAGYLVGKYVSIEKAIEQSKVTYYEALQASSIGWNEGENNYEPFVRYLLGVILSACREFESRIDLIGVPGLSKAQRVEAVFDRRLGKISKADIMEECPDISKSTVERALSDLLAKGKIKKLGAGPATAYVKVEQR